MKTRQGFVSNSSSSSFIIAISPEIDTPSKHLLLKLCDDEYLHDAEIEGWTGSWASLAEDYKERGWKITCIYIDHGGEELFETLVECNTRIVILDREG